MNCAVPSARPVCSVALRAAIGVSSRRGWNAGAKSYGRNARGKEVPHFLRRIPALRPSRDRACRAIRILSRERRVNTALSATYTYAYDPLGRRVSKTVGGTNTFYLNPGSDEIAEYGTDGATLTRRFVPGPGVDQPIAMVTAAGVKTFFHQDKLGSVIAMTSTTGALVEGPFTYDVYGNSSTSSDVPYRYTGRRYDAGEAE